MGWFITSIREKREKTTQFIKSVVSGCWIREKVEKGESYESAVAFSDTYQPHAERDYGWALDYAVKEYELASLRAEYLEGKADSLIGYLGAASGLISIGLAYGIGDHRGRVLLAAIPALLLLLSGIVLALISRIPSKSPSLPHCKDALEYMQKDDLAAGKFAAYIWTSTRALALTTSEKAKLVRSAYVCFGFGIVWLVLSSTVVALVRHFAS
ncbi:MAG: hypothetical protein ACRD4S_15625 [Candidatus Acidiferrales bacterium]